MGSLIDLGKLVEPDITKRKGRGKPNAGLDVAAWNAANPQHPKDARGRWTDNPVGQAIAQAYSNVRERRRSSNARGGIYDSESVIPISEIRDELGGAFTREQVDTELKRLARAQAAGGDPDVTVNPQSNQKILTESVRAGALRMGGEDKHIIEIRGDLPPASPRRPKTHAEQNAPGQLGVLVPFGGELEHMVQQRRERMPSDMEAVAGGVSEMDDHLLAAIHRAAKDLVTAAGDELDKRRRMRTAAAKAKPTKRLSAKPKPDLIAIGAALGGDTTRAAAHARLEGLTNADLRELAGNEGVAVNSSWTKQELKNTIVQHKVGFRADNLAIMAGASRDNTVDMDAARAHLAPQRDLKTPQERLREQSESARAGGANVTRTGIQAKQEIVAQLDAATSVKEVDDALQGLKVAELRELAEAADVPLAGARTKAQIVDQFRYHKVIAPLGFDRSSGRLDEELQQRRASREPKVTPERTLEAYRELHKEFGNEWVALSQLRGRLGGTREEQDLALDTLVRSSRIRLIPEENQKTLTDADRAAAITVGGEPKHLIGIPYTPPNFPDGPTPPKFPAGPGGGRTKSDIQDEISSLTQQRGQLREEVASRYGDDPDRWPEERDDWDVAEYHRITMQIQRLRRQAEQAPAAAPPPAPVPTAPVPTAPVPTPAPAAPARALTPLERELKKAQARAEKISGRLGLAGDRRRRKGGLVASAEEARLRSQLTEARNQERDLERRVAQQASNPTPSAPAAPASPAVARLTRPGITRAEIEAELAGLKVAELRALAAELAARQGTVSAKGRTKADIQHNITEGLIGFRERAAAIGGWGENASRPGQGKA